MAIPGGREKRRFYRIHYSLSNCPAIHIDGYDYRIADISEGGICFYNAKKCVIFGVNQTVCGLIKFQVSKPAFVKGYVLRIIDNRIIIRLTTGIPSQTIFEQQRFAINESLVMRR